MHAILGEKRQTKPRKLCGGRLLLWCLVGEGDALCDVALQALDTSLEKSLLVIIQVCEGVVNLLNTACLL